MASEKAVEDVSVVAESKKVEHNVDVVDSIPDILDLPTEKTDYVNANVPRDEPVKV